MLDIQVAVLEGDGSTTYTASDDATVQAAVDAYESTSGLASDFFGCPDAHALCNEIVLTYTGLHLERDPQLPGSPGLGSGRRPLLHGVEPAGAAGAMDDHFVFNFTYDDGEGDHRLGGYGGYTDFPGNRARFTGDGLSTARGG